MSNTKTMSKLEQCVLLVRELDKDDGRFSLSRTADEKGFSIYVKASCFDGEVRASGFTIDEAAAKLHADLAKRTIEMRRTLRMFDAEGEFDE